MTDEESIFSLNFHACSKEQSKEQRNCQQVNFQQAQNYYCATTQHNNNLPSNSKLDFGQLYIVLPSNICSGHVLQDIQVAAMTNMINDINELLLFMDLQSSQKPQTGLCPSTTFTTASVTSRNHMTDEKSI